MVPPPGRSGLGVSPLWLLRLIDGVALVQWVVWACRQLRHELPREATGKRPRGHPEVYPEEAVLLIALVMRCWRLSYEGMMKWLEAWPALRVACGLRVEDGQGQLRVISVSQFSRRVRRWGTLPYFLLFLVLVQRLVTLNVIKGYDLILDSTLVEAWSRRDEFAAWSYPKKWVGSLYSYKVHTLLCRSCCLPVMVAVTPGNVSDSVLAIPLLWAAKVLFGFWIRVVRADAAYHTKAITGFVQVILGAVFVVDQNPRRKGKKQIASWWVMRVLRGILGKRSMIERFFAFAKRYFGLGEFQLVGRDRVSRHVLLTYCSMLSVATVAVKLGRRDLMQSPGRVLAYYYGP